MGATHKKSSCDTSFMNTSQALSSARVFKKNLLDRGIPVHRVILFGSCARGVARDESDVDIAVVCNPFRETRHDENVEFLSVGHDTDMRIETICLHPEDLENRYSTIVQEVKKYGIEV